MNRPTIFYEYLINEDGTTTEIRVDNTPDWHRLVDSAGMLTFPGLCTLLQDRRLDEHERRPLL